MPDLRLDRGWWIRLGGALLIAGGIGWTLVVVGILVIFTGLGEELTPAALFTFLGALVVTVGGGIVAGIGVRRRWTWARAAGIGFACAICVLRVGYVVSSFERGGDVTMSLWGNAALIAPAVAVICILLFTWSAYRDRTPPRTTIGSGTTPLPHGR